MEPYNNNKKLRLVLIKFLIAPVFLIIVSQGNVYSQQFPCKKQNIPWLFTSGINAETGLGDDDHVQILYYVIPADYSGRIFLWIEDITCNSKNDLINGKADSNFRFRIFGMENLYQAYNEENYESGKLLSDTIINSNTADILVMPPFYAWEGEQIREMNESFFKVLINGVSGDDGNYYRLFFSTSSKERISPTEGKILYNELCFVMPDTGNRKGFLFPEVPYGAEGITLTNFDWDHSGNIRIFSDVRKKQLAAESGNNEYRITMLKIFRGETGHKLSVELELYPDYDKEDHVASFSWIIEDDKGNDISLPLPSSNEKSKRSVRNFFSSDR